MAGIVTGSCLACSVRECARPLTRLGRTLTCPLGHTYDIARRGYVNLLQPQDRRSTKAGDAKEAMAARARLLAAGVGRTILDAFVQMAATDLRAGAVVVDLGSGAGDGLATLAETQTIDGIGIDLSTAATDYAARRFPALTWVVANADRRLPLLDGCVDLVLSFNARRHPIECARVLAPHGVLLVAIPAEDDLVELREAVQGTGDARDRADALVADHAPLFSVASRGAARERHGLDRAALLDLLRATYRGARTSTAARVEALDRLDVTLASTFVKFARST